MKSIYFLLLIMITVKLSTACYKAYLEPEFRGRSFSGCPTGCETISKNWKIHFKSINTQGGCIRLFESKDCKGRSIDIKPGTKTHNNLRSIGWTKTSSLKNC